MYFVLKTGGEGRVYTFPKAISPIVLLELELTNY